MNRTLRQALWFTVSGAMLYYCVIGNHATEPRPFQWLNDLSRFNMHLIVRSFRAVLPSRAFHVLFPSFADWLFLVLPGIVLGISTWLVYRLITHLRHGMEGPYRVRRSCHLLCTRS